MNFFEELKNIHLDPIVVILILAAGFWQKTYLKSWTKLTLGKWSVTLSSAWRTLTIGTIFSLLYVGVVHWSGMAKDYEWTDLYYSYIFTTSFYELIVGPFSNWLKSKFTNTQ